MGVEGEIGGYATGRGLLRWILQQRGCVAVRSAPACPLAVSLQTFSFRTDVPSDYGGIRPTPARDGEVERASLR